MQKNQNTVIFFLSILTLVVLAVYFIFFRKEKTNWNEHYQEQSKDPYGISVMYELLKKRGNSFKDINSTYNLFIEKHAASDTNSSIVFLNPYAFMAESEIPALLNWVNKGNTIFMLTESIPPELIAKIYPYSCLHEEEWRGLASFSDSVVHPNFSLTSLRDSVDYEYKAPYQGPDFFDLKAQYDWRFFDSKDLCDDSDTIFTCGYLSSSPDSGYVNFIYIPYGKGGFYIHTNPIFFTNYYLKEYAHLNYTSKVFKHLNNGAVYFDKYHKSYWDQNNGGHSSAGPLIYILSQPYLRYGWYLLLFTLILYIFFRAKREQKPIPILEEKRNTTLEYYKTVGSLYFQQKDPYKISLLMFKMFRIYVREKYKINIKNNDEYTVKQLSSRSDMDEAFIEKLLTTDKYVNTSPAITHKDVVTYYQKLNYFYTNCK